MILLDTHVVLWLDQGTEDLGKQSRQMLDSAQSRGEISVSAISFWEIAMLVGKNRIRMSLDLTDWRQSLLSAGMREWAIDGATGILAARLNDLHGGPADRMIVATAVHTGATLVTADQRLLDWPGTVKRHDARI